MLIRNNRIFVKFKISSIHTVYMVSQQVLALKIAKCCERRKNSWKFVYVLANQSRYPFNLTEFLTISKLLSLALSKSFLPKTCWDTLYVIPNFSLSRLWIQIPTLRINFTRAILRTPSIELETKELNSFVSNYIFCINSPSQISYYLRYLT